jgi:hypothetical protein
MLLLPEFRWAGRGGVGCGDNEERRRVFLYRGSSCSLQAGRGGGFQRRKGLRLLGLIIPLRFLRTASQLQVRMGYS